ncbi:amino acid ABC transporter substrate-binding protein [Orrella sp. NBD-18]|uniref:Amino acid ABC transporter substrate-binding protein n=1 Tax=Sheuella amnicola TaxID=2707330 RepID=A0A6B2R028_9BURK|nr:amino acid ABC transporter substrate-binding protein [Sheuella amnicola]NDY82769.1 amino acid ABC transporter substrate-binding protein [Sheuella amnicola]HBI84004.1 amino acid ABC transporter substrate-binding protein [Alcaligenaceae bacterium]
MQSKYLKYGLATLAGLVLGGSVMAQDLTGTLKKIKETGSITIGTRDASIPFSYNDDKQQVVGYAFDICLFVVEEIKRELKLPKLEVKQNPVTSATRIPLIANGTVDLECGSTTNNAERQKQVDFGPTYYLTASRYVSKTASGIKDIKGLKGKTVVSTAGTTNLKLLIEANKEQNLDMNILTAKDHSEGFLMVETGRAAAFVMDDILLAGLVANSKAPKDYVISSDAFSKPEPYGFMMRRDDPQFKKVVDAAAAKLYKSAEMQTLYSKWFEKPIPPKGVNLNQPMTAELKKALANPTNNPDPASY